MKWALLIGLLISSFAYAEEKIDLTTITKKTLEQNLTVLQNAEKVYQAKLSIDEARLSMLPKLNIWTIGKVAIDPAAFLDVAQEIAPFLVPSNWFRMKETELFYQAERAGFASLRANELYQARSLYFKVLLDNELLSTLKKYEVELAEIQSVAEDRYDLGLEKIEFVREIKIQHLNVLEDITNLKLLTDFERTSLLSAMGMSLDSQTPFASITFNPQDMNRINPGEWESMILKKSPEVQQLNFLIDVVPLVKNEVRFSILGVPSISRGTSGGVFDDLPESNGLGFSTGKQIALVESKKNMLDLQVKSEQEVLKRQLVNMSNQINSIIQLRDIQNERLNLSMENFKSYKEKILLGSDISYAEFVQNITTLIQSVFIYQNTITEYLQQKDMFDRLTFQNDYSSLEFQIVMPEAGKNCRKTIFGNTKCDR